MGAFSFFFSNQWGRFCPFSLCLECQKQKKTLLKIHKLLMRLRKTFQSKNSVTRCVSVCVHSSQKEDGGYAILLLIEKINQMSRHCQLKQTADV